MTSDFLIVYGLLSIDYVTVIKETQQGLAMKVVC